MNDAAQEIGARLASLYRRIEARTMRGLPVHNPRLEVQAVGFRPCRGWAIGGLVTPWFMNIVLAELPGGPPLPAARPGDSHGIDLPAGRVAFVVGRVEEFGRLDSASLFSPMTSFDDPEATRLAAEAAVTALLQPPPPPAAPPRHRRDILFGRGVAAP